MTAKRRIVAWLAALPLLCLLLFSVFPSPVEADGTADLQLIDFYWNTDTEIKPGTAVTFTVTVRNGGSSAVTQPFTVTFGTAKTVFTALTHNGGLASGASVTLTSRPWTAKTGDYMVAACVNGDRTVAESDYTNNSAQANLRVALTKLSPANDRIADLMKQGGLTTLIFSDDFNSTDTMDLTNSAQAGYKWYVDHPYGASPLTAQDFTLKNGVLTLHQTTQSYYYAFGTMSCQSHLGFGYTTGYMEARLRVPRPRANTDGEEGFPAIWSLPPEKLYGPDNHWVELDWLEYWGDNSYSITLHEQYRDDNGKIYQHNKNSNHDAEGLNDGEWHVMGWLWQEGLLITYYDGEEVMRLTWREGEYADPVQITSKGLPMEGAFVHLDEQSMPIFINGSQDNPMELDYIRVWSGSSTLVPPVINREQTAADFLKQYLTGDDGVVITTVNAENYAAVLNGLSAWDAMTTAERTAVNEALAALGRSSYPALLVTAQSLKQAVTPSATVTSPTVGTTVPGSTTTTATAAISGTTVTEPSDEGATTAPTTATTTDGSTTTVPTVAVSTEPETRRSFWLPWGLLIAAGAAALVGGGLYCVWRRQRR